jgi:hypothetical protein
MRAVRILLLLLAGLSPALLATAVALLSYRAPAPAYYRPAPLGGPGSELISGEYDRVPYRFKLGFVEFNDEGYLVDPQQEQALLSEIEADAGQPGFDLVVLYVHGWNHDAGMDDSNVGCFREFLRAAAVMQAHYEQKKKQPRRVHGIYAGWPGVVYPHSQWRQATTFWGREAAVDRLAERGALLQLISRISAIKHKAGPRRVMFVAVGHSLGGRSLYRALRPLIQNSLAAADYAAQLPPIADLALMVNPALTADDHKTLFDLMTASPHATGAVPRFVIATSRADSVLRRQFRWSRYVGTLVRGDFAMSTDSRTTALGAFQPYVTHSLSLTQMSAPGYENGNGDTRCPSMTLDELDIVRRAATIENSEELYRFDTIVHRDSRGKALYRTELKRASAASGPLMVVEVDGKIIPDHNDLFTAPFVDFVARMLNSEFYRNQPGR